ncbi:MAG: hypothetical protein ACJA1E_000486 [Paracoccaceae bacterium]|jgi:hypothetical protein
MRKAEIVTAVILGVFSLYLMWKSGEPPSWDPEIARFANIWMVEGEGPGSGFWPFWLSGIMFVCTVWIGVNWVRGTSPQSVSEEPFLDGYGIKVLLMVGVGLFGFLVLIALAGFYGGMFVFMIYYMKVLGRHAWWLTLTLAAVLPVIFFLFFDVAMRIFLPKGYLEPLFIPLYDLFL